MLKQVALKNNGINLFINNKLSRFRDKVYKAQTLNARNLNDFRLLSRHAIFNKH